MKHSPVRDMLLVKKIDMTEEKVGSFFIVRDKPKNNIAYGVVEAVGRGYINAQGINIRSQYKENDVVVFKLHSQVDEVSDNGIIKYILTSAEVIATADLD